MTRSMASGIIGSGALFAVIGLFLLVSWVMTEEPVFAYVGLPIVLLGAGFAVWGVVSLRRLPAPPARPATELKRQTEGGLRLLAVGVVVAAAGAFLWGRPVTCDDREMHRGDSCFVSSGGGSHSESYEDRLEQQQLLAGSAVGLGTLLGLAGGWWAATGEIGRRRGRG